ncbi:MAG: hypothetical protein ACLUEQ_12520 [Cloacibacillus evryensis]
MLAGLLFGGTVIEGQCDHPADGLFRHRDNLRHPRSDRGGAHGLPCGEEHKGGCGRRGTAGGRRWRNRGLSLLPAAPWKFALALAIPIILLSFTAFWSVMAFFRFDELNFFQFFLIRVIFVSLLSKAVVRLAIRRYFSPPDVVKE